MVYDNEMTLRMSAKSQNEAFARVAVAAFAAQLDPTVAEITDIKTAVSEAVTNAIIHGYEGQSGYVTLAAGISDHVITIEVTDEGLGIGDIEKAMEPLYTSKPEQERSGMGFTVMETFMDSLQVSSEPGRGTKVTMTKTLSR